MFLVGSDGFLARPCVSCCSFILVILIILPRICNLRVTCRAIRRGRVQALLQR